jgi:uncharacterized protein YjbI with pentapeptide repeats
VRSSETIVKKFHRWIDKAVETQGLDSCPFPASDRRKVFRERVDLRGSDLRGLDLQGLDFSDCYVRQSDLHSVDFSRARLDGASSNASII